MRDPITIREEVIAALGWDLEQYAWMQYEYGLAFLNHYLSADPGGQDILAREPGFWAWWKMSWLNRDKLFLFELSHYANRHAAIEDYHRLNNVEFLYRALRIPRHISSVVVRPERYRQTQ